MKGVSAYLVSWKDIDYNVMSVKFIYIVVSRWELGWGRARGKMIRKRFSKIWWLRVKKMFFLSVFYFDFVFVLYEVMSKPSIVLFCMFMSLIVLSKSPEFLTCEVLIVPSRGVNTLAMARPILLSALPMLEKMGRRGVAGLWILGRLYNVGIVGYCSMRDVQVFWFFTSF